MRAYRILFKDGGPVTSEQGPPNNETGLVEKLEPPEYELSFWDSVRESDNPAEFEAYLEKYPEGSFAALATERRKVLGQKKDDPETPEVNPVELAFWESIKDSDNPDMFRTYLETYPNGAFADIARIQIEQCK